MKKEEYKPLFEDIKKGVESDLNIEAQKKGKSGWNDSLFEISNQNKANRKELPAKIFRMIVSVPVSFLGLFALDLFSPYIIRIFDLFEGNNPNGILTIFTDYILYIGIVPILSVYLLIFLFGKIYPISKSKYIVSVVYMSLLIILNCFILFSYIFFNNFVWQGIARDSVYVVSSIIALIYAVKSNGIYKTESL